MSNLDAVTELRQSKVTVRELSKRSFSVTRSPIDEATRTPSPIESVLRSTSLNSLRKWVARHVLPQRDAETWIQTYSGGQIWPLNPRVEDISIEDIAHGLSNCCRYAGQCNKFFSVAQHSVLVSQHVPEPDALWGLLHDASEAFLADVCRPIKRFLGNYHEIEERLMRAIAAKFDLAWPMPQSVKTADNRALVTERRDLMATPPHPWVLAERVEPFDEKIEPMVPSMAKLYFMARFRELTEPASVAPPDPIELERFAGEGGPEPMAA